MNTGTIKRTTVKGNDVSEIGPKEVKDGVDTFLWGSGIFAMLIAVIWGMSKAAFNRLLNRVDKIEEDYVPKDRHRRLEDKLESLDNKFDHKTDEIKDLFLKEHNKTQNMIIDLIKKS